MDRKQIESRMKQMIDMAEKEKRDLTAEEDVTYNGLEIALKQAQLVEGKTARSIPIPQPQRGDGVEEVYTERGVIGALKDPKKFFFNGRLPVNKRTMAGYLADIIQNKNMVPDESREMSLGSGVHGGFAAPEAYAAGFWQSTNNASVCLPLCRMYDFQGSNILHCVAWDSEDQSTGPWGGVAAQWVAEGGTSTPVEPSLRTLTFKANKLTIFVDVTREATQNATGLVAELGSAMTRAATYEFDNCIINGNGVARPLGILESGSAVDVSRAVANQIAYADVINLYRRLYPGFIKGAAWLASPDTIGQLLTLSDPASNYIWTPSSEGVANSRPGYLLGLPVYLTDKCPKLGTRGDLILADLSAYGVAVAQQVVLEKTESAKWYQDIYSFRSILRADGGPMMDSAITPKNGGASMSWAVVLD